MREWVYFPTADTPELALSDAVLLGYVQELRSALLKMDDLRAPPKTDLGGGEVHVLSTCIMFILQTSMSGDVISFMVPGGPSLSTVGERRFVSIAYRGNNPVAFLAARGVVHSFVNSIGGAVWPVDAATQLAMRISEMTLEDDGYKTASTYGGQEEDTE